MLDDSIIFYYSIETFLYKSVNFVRFPFFTIFFSYRTSEAAQKALEIHTEKFLSELRGLKFVETLEVTFEKYSPDDEITIKTVYFNCKAQTIINEGQIEPALESSTQEILNNIAKWISEGSNWTIQSIDGHYLNIVKYQPLRGNYR